MKTEREPSKHATVTVAATKSVINYFLKKKIDAIDDIAFDSVYAVKCVH